MNQFNGQGFGLAIIIFALLVTEIALNINKKVRKVTNCYFFWLGIGLFCLIWLIAFRFASDWARYANYLKEFGITTTPKGYEESVIISKALLLDVCPAVGLLMPLLLIVDPSRKAARCIAPITLIGGALIIFCDIPTAIESEFSWQFIFLGVGDNECYFIMHAFNLLLSVGVLLNTPKFGWKGFVWALGATILFYIYVIIAKAITGCSYFVSGLSTLDWTQGEYMPAAQVIDGFLSIFGVKNISQYAYPIIGIPSMTLVGFGIVALNDYVFKNYMWRYGNKRGQKWYFWYDYNCYVKDVIC